MYSFAIIFVFGNSTHYSLCLNLLFLKLTFIVYLKLWGIYSAIGILFSYGSFSASNLEIRFFPPPTQTLFNCRIFASRYNLFVNFTVLQDFYVLHLLLRVFLMAATLWIPVLISQYKLGLSCAKLSSSWG